MIIAVFIFFIVAIIMLVRFRLINIDLSFPWFILLIILAGLSTNKGFIITTAALLDIKTPPLVIILLTLLIFLGLITVLGIYVTELRQRLNVLTRKIAVGEISDKYTS